MGAGIAASPHCAERRICRCSVYLVPAARKLWFPASRSWLTSSGVAFHRTAPSEKEPDFYSTAPPEGSLVFRCPACPLEPDLPNPDLAIRVLKPPLPAKAVRCSAALLGVTTLASRFALPHRNASEPRRARDRYLFRRLFPAGPEKNPKVSSNCLPAEIGSSVPSSPVWPLPAFRRDWDVRPDHLRTMHLSAESQKQNFR